MSHSTRTRRPRLNVSRLEDRTMPSGGIADLLFVGPLQNWQAAPSAAAGLDYDPANVGPQAIHLPQLTPLPHGTPDPGLGVTGDRVPANPAFDADGHALINNKSRFNNDLLRLYDGWQQFGSGWKAHAFQGADNVDVDDRGNVGVQITARDVDALKPALEAAGFHTHYALPQQHLFEGTIPISSLPNLAPLSAQGLMGVDAIGKSWTKAGLVTSQADWVHQADRSRAQTFATGTGVRIGVLSDSFNTGLTLPTNATMDIANGDLPAGGVQVLAEGPFLATDEGRGMMQLIHDIAPGAALSFATGYGGQAAFAANIRRLANPLDGNCKIIVDDLSYADPMFQDGLVAQAIQDVVTNRQVTYFSAAGNDGSQSYESPRWATNVALVGGIFGSWYDFDTGNAIDPTLGVTIAQGQKVSLDMQWDQPFFTASGVTTDLDLFLIDNVTGQVVASSTFANPSTQKPQESINYTNNTGDTSFSLAVRLFDGPAVNRIKIVNYGNGNFITFDEYPADCNKSTIQGHSGTNFEVGVGALPYSNHTNPEGATSRGPLTTYFDAAGNRLATPIVSDNPRLGAVDGTNTSFFGGGDFDHDGFPNFFGTSAAAPAAAAVAALVLSANSTFDTNTLVSRLENTADGAVGTPGIDPFTGYGLIDAYRAVTGGVQVPGQVNVSDSFESGYLGQNWDTYTNGAGRVQIRTDAGPATGTYHVTLDSECGQDPNNSLQVNSLSEAILHVPTAGVNNLVLKFKSKRWSINGEPAMPTSFVGHGNFGGVAFSTDGTNWHRLAFIDAYQYNDNTIDLAAAAAAAGVALSADTQIKFQSYGPRSIIPDFYGGGRGFDDISVTRYGDLTNGQQTNDLNGNGVADAGEPALAGWRTYLDTNNNGRFDRPGISFVSSGNAVPIPDNGTLNSVVPVSGLTGVISDVDVTLDIVHGYTSDLSIFLISPNNTSVQLFNRYGSSGDNLTDTSFDDAAFTPIANGYGPFSGTYRPTGSLATFNGLSGAQMNGNWTLRVIDNASGDTGTLNSWSVKFSTKPTFTSSNSIAIPDFIAIGDGLNYRGPSTILSTMQVNGVTGPIDHVRVGLNINHTYDADITAFLVSPTGVRVRLLNRNGGSGDNFTNTIFDDFNATPISAGVAPFIGTFRPDQPLGYLTGLSGAQVNGTWTLELHDNGANDTGTLTGWSLTIETGEPYALTDTNGNYSFYNLAGNHTLTEEHQAGWKPTFPPIGNTWQANFDSGFSIGNIPFLVTADSTSPTATVTPIGPALTNASSVQFTVAFSDPVYYLNGNNAFVGPTTANFTAGVAGGITGAYVSNVAPTGGNTYTVTVNTGTGDGTLRLVLNTIDLVDAGYNAVSSPVLSSLFTIEKTAPTANIVVGDGTAQRSLIFDLTVNFGEIITYVGAPAAAFTLEKIVGGMPNGTVAFTVNTATVGGHTQATINFTSDTTFGSLNDGRYRLTVNANQIRDLAGNVMAANVVQNFHRFYGDMTGDARDDISDFGFFSLAYLSPANYNESLDYNNDGLIDIADFGQFSVRYFTNLP